MRLMGRRHKTKTSPAQRDSEISILRMGEHYYRRGRRERKGGIFTMRIKNITGYFMGRRGNEPMSKMQKGPAQQNSRMSNFGRLSVLSGQETENSLPQRHSKMSNLGFAAYCHSKHQKNEISTMQIRNTWGLFMGKLTVIKTSIAQRDSELSKLGMGLIGTMGPIGLMGKKPVMKNRPAQRDSKMSILKVAAKNSPAQRDSKISRLVNRGINVKNYMIQVEFYPGLIIIE